MNYLQTISQIAIIVFALMYVVGTIWHPEIIRKKSLLKKTLKKNKIDLWFMEFQQALIKKLREKALVERETISKQIKELEELKASQEAELKELKEDKTKLFPEVEAKNKEIKETETQKATLIGEIANADRMIKIAEGKVGEYTFQMSILERSIEEGKDLIKKLC